MAKQPKKPSKSSKPAAKTAKKPNASAKPVKRTKPKPTKQATARLKPSPKPKPSAKPKPKPTTKAGSKKAAKATKEVSALLTRPQTPTAGSIGVPGVGANATPQITAPQAGPVPATVDLPVRVNTNRADLGYIIAFTDISSPQPPPPVQINVTPTGNNFTGTIPGQHIAPNCSYQIRVFVNPGDGLTPPNQDDAVKVNTPGNSVVSGA